MSKKAFGKVIPALNLNPTTDMDIWITKQIQIVALYYTISVVFSKHD